MQQILTFSRKGEQSFVVRPLQPLIEEAVRFLRSTIPLSVQFDVTLPNEPLCASIDATQIEQVLINLCTNAWHAMKDNQGRIEIRVEEVQLDQTAEQISPDLRAGRHICLKVTDNGSGMDDKTLAHIFEPFFTTKGVGLGTGLGLSVVHGIVKSHQGAITVDSVLGTGTTFAVYLPAVDRPVDASQLSQSERSDAAPALANGGGSGKRVIYVDDDEALVLLVERMLTQLGYTAKGYAVGADAVAAVQADPMGCDMVVSDFNMPGMSGLDVASAVKGIRPDLLVVIFSGYVTDELRTSAIDVGVREVISKSNTVAEMCRSIQVLLTASTVGAKRPG